jgi:hypothetical protein
MALRYILPGSSAVEQVAVNHRVAGSTPALVVLLP